MFCYFFSFMFAAHKKPNRVKVMASAKNKVDSEPVNEPVAVAVVEQPQIKRRKTKSRIGKEKLGDSVSFTDGNGVLQTGVLTAEGETKKIVDGKRCLVRELTVCYTDAVDGFERYAEIDQTCIAPEDSKVDWSTIYCTQQTYKDVG